MSTADSIMKSFEAYCSGENVNEMAREFILVAFSRVLDLRDEVSVTEDEDGPKLLGPGVPMLNLHAATLAIILQGVYSDPDRGKGSPCLG